MHQCEYRYKDGAQCIIDKLPEHRKMCTEHAILTRRAEEKRLNDAKRYQRNKHKRPSRAKVKPEGQMTVKIPETGPQYYDHTAPWRCGFEGCKTCKGKPTYEEYMTAKFAKKGT